MDIYFDNSARGGQMRSRFRQVSKKIGLEGNPEKAFEILLSLGEEALTLSERQGPQKVVLRAGTPGRGRQVVEVDVATILFPEGG
jgi:hypothetical protein